MDTLQIQLEEGKIFLALMLKADTYYVSTSTQIIYIMGLRI